jgi:hypothetical protein
MKEIIFKSMYFIGAAICIAGIYIFHTYTINLGEWYPIVGNFVSAYGGLVATIWHYYITYLKK